MIKALKNQKVVVMIIALATLMRLVAINQSLWLDEAIGAIVVRDYSYGEILTEFIRSDNHTPLYYLDLKFWSDIFGHSELSLRLPSVIYGVLTIYIVYLIAQKLAGVKNQLFPILTILLLATSQFHIYYSQEARMYSLATFFVSLAVYAFLNVLEDKDNFYWKLFSFSIVGLIFTDYVPVFVLPIFVVYAPLKKKKAKWWGKFVLYGIPLFILGTAWLPTMLVQVRNYVGLLSHLPAWKQVAGGATFKQAVLVWMKFVFGRISLVDKFLYYLLVCLASIPVVVSMINSLVKTSCKKINIVWLWLVLPLICGFLVSFVFPVFIYFRFMYVIPAFYMMIAWGIAQMRKKGLRYVVVVLLLISNFVSWIIYITDDHQQREQWRQATRFVEKSVVEGDVIIFEYPEPFAPYRWYSSREVEAYGVTDSVSADSAKTEQITRYRIAEKSGVYYFEYLRELSDPDRVVEKVLREEGFEVSEIYNFSGVGLVYYWTRE